MPRSLQKGHPRSREAVTRSYALISHVGLLVGATQALENVREALRKGDGPAARSALDRARELADNDMRGDLARVCSSDVLDEMKKTIETMP